MNMTWTTTVAVAAAGAAGMSHAAGGEAALGFANSLVTEGSLVARIESAVIIPGVAQDPAKGVPTRLANDTLLDETVAFDRIKF